MVKSATFVKHLQTSLVVGSLVDLPDSFVDLPDSLVDLPDSFVDLPDSLLDACPFEMLAHAAFLTFENSFSLAPRDILDVSAENLSPGRHLSSNLRTRRWETCPKGLFRVVLEPVEQISLLAVDQRGCGLDVCFADYPYCSPVHCREEGARCTHSPRHPPEKSL